MIDPRAEAFKMKSAIEDPATCSLVMRFTPKEKGRIRNAAKISGWRDSASWGRKILVEIAEAVLRKVERGRSIGTRHRTQER
jgi:hypothetical protein